MGDKKKAVVAAQRLSYLRSERKSVALPGLAPFAHKFVQPLLLQEPSSFQRH
jgi:hypothetical protein